LLGPNCNAVRALQEFIGAGQWAALADWNVMNRRAPRLYCENQCHNQP
jgi:hypothetical protein